MAEKRSARHRAWCFTLNNYTEEDVSAVVAEAADTEYLVFGREVGDSGTPHLQGYVRFVHPRTFTGIKARPGFRRAHLEVARGTAQENRRYCTKSGTFSEFGELPAGQGNRTDLLTYVEGLKGGLSDRALLEAGHVQCVARYPKLADIVRRAYAPSVRDPPSVVWVHGDSGRGKTRWAFDVFHDVTDSVWLSSPAWPRWWEGYTGQSVVVIDDFRAKQCSFAALLRYLDRYPVYVEDKGRSIQLAAKVIIITCPESYQVVFQDYSVNDFAQIARRIGCQIAALPSETGEPCYEVDLDSLRNDCAKWRESVSTPEDASLAPNAAVLSELTRHLREKIAGLE